MQTKPLNQIVIGIKGAGEMASAIAWRLYQANLRRIFMMEVPGPLAVRRQVSFCEALNRSPHVVEGLTARQAATHQEIADIWASGSIAVIADPQWHQIKAQQPDVVIDAILAKRNLGTHLKEANLVIGLGPGFTAGQDTHLVIETKRGHDLGRIITTGSAQPNTGIPGNIGGFTEERVLRAPADGIFNAHLDIGTLVQAQTPVGDVAGILIHARIDGVIRGLIRSGMQVTQGLKLGDIDPRGDPSFCGTISDKARAIAGSVLEAILRVYNPPLQSKNIGSDQAAQNDAGIQTMHPHDLIEDIRQGKMRAVAKAIDWVENEPSDLEPLLGLIVRHTGRARRIGITGPPGAGKSTLVNQLIKHLRRQKLSIGVIAVDPSSPFTGGALFGDRLRMAAAQNDPDVYIRSMGSRGSLGGLAHQATAAADILDVSGKDVVIFETVGVGQAEIDIVAAADTIIVLNVPEAGDTVQSMKAGLMEIGHLFVVNKADLPGADRMQRDLESALHLQRSSEKWQPPVLTAQAASGEGLEEIIRAIEDHHQFLNRGDRLATKRLQQAENRIKMWVNERLSQHFWNVDRTERLRTFLRESGYRESPPAIVEKLFSTDLAETHPLKK